MEGKYPRLPYEWLFLCAYENYLGIGHSRVQLILVIYYHLLQQCC